VPCKFLELSKQLVSGIERARREGEIQIFRKALGFEIAFLQARSALEDPVLSKLRVLSDPDE
jgi:hypothetical protein